MLYRHEPDRIDRGVGIPQILDRDGSAAHLEAGRVWLDRLGRLRAFEANTIPPFFPKRWTGRRDRLRRGLQLAARWAGAGLHRVRLGLPLVVPDCVGLDAGPGEGPIIVIKSVSSLGRAGLIHEAGASVIVILRHPCGYVASILHGVRTGRMGEIGFAYLKLRLIGAISAVEFLKATFPSGSYSNVALARKICFQLAFVVSGVLSAVTERIAKGTQRVK